MRGDEQLSTGPVGWRSLVPGIDLVTRYRCAWLGRDIVAGLVLSVALVPQGMAYAEVAGTSRLCRQRRTEFALSVIALLGVAFLGVLPGIVTEYNR